MLTDQKKIKAKNVGSLMFQLLYDCYFIAYSFFAILFFFFLFFYGNGASTNYNQLNKSMNVLKCTFYAHVEYCWAHCLFLAFASSWCVGCQPFLAGLHMGKIEKGCDLIYIKPL